MNEESIQRQIAVVEEIGALHGILERLAPEGMVQPLGPGDK